jgi:thiamine-monophosphate kinase
MTTLGDLGEFGLIDRLSRLLPSAPTVVEGIGDDCAVLRLFDRLMLISCDMVVETIHFRREYATPEDIGWKAATAALSDIAAMGGTPLFVLVALAMPGMCEIHCIEGIYRGLADAVSQVGAVIVGGDTTRTPGYLTIDVTVVGEAIGDRYVARRGARLGDLLCVAGRLGMASAGLHSLEQGEPQPELVRVHNRPTALITQGQWLGACPGVRAMIDVSDGLVQDAGHIAKAANLGVDIDPARIPIDPALEEYCRKAGLDARRFALTGGEDYALAFAIAPGAYEVCLTNFRREFRTEITVVGEFTSAWKGVRVAGHPADRGGFDHFR